MTSRPDDLSLSKVQREFLVAVNQFRFVTTAQLSRLLYPNLHDNNREAQRRTKELVDEKQVLLRFPGPPPAVGKPPDVFTVSWQGKRYLERLGYQVPSYTRPSEIAELVRNQLFMPHTLAVHDVLVAAKRLSRDVPGASLRQLFLERELKNMRMRVLVHPTLNERQEITRRAIYTGELMDVRPKAVTVVPDALFQIEIAGTMQTFLLELDRGSERPAVWKNKVAALATWISSPHREQLAADYLTIMIVAPTRQRRDYLRAWTTQELRDRQEEDLSVLFAFTNASAVTLSPTAFFCGTHWLMPSV